MIYFIHLHSIYLYSSWWDKGQLYDYRSTLRRSNWCGISIGWRINKMTKDWKRDRWRSQRLQYLNWQRAMSNQRLHYLNWKRAIRKRQPDSPFLIKKKKANKHKVKILRLKKRKTKKQPLAVSNLHFDQETHRSA